MMHFYRLIIVLFFSYANPVFSADNTQMEVWANEAIVATYTFDYQNFLDQQKRIAKYFTAEGWIAYSTALQKSGLPEQIKKNAWTIGAVATMPPVITAVHAAHWKAEMPILVIYKNKETVKKQAMKVSMTFTTSPEGIRGFGITSLNTQAIDKPCQCDLQTSSGTPAATKK